jgi:hypothetical protein
MLSHFSVESQRSSQASQKTRSQRTFVKRCSKSSWTEAEDQQLQQIMLDAASDKRWCHMKDQFPTKTASQICRRWTLVLDPRIRKGSWTVGEDEAICRWVDRHGTEKWRELSATLLTHRTGKQCRERWANQLRPEGSQAAWTEEDDGRLVELRRRIGNRWSALAAFFPGRTENQVKNRWYSTVSRRLQRAERGEPPDHKRGPKTGQRRRQIDVDGLSPTLPGGFDDLFERDIALPFQTVAGQGGSPLWGGEVEHSLFDSQF